MFFFFLVCFSEHTAIVFLDFLYNAGWSGWLSALRTVPVLVLVLRGWVEPWHMELSNATGKILSDTTGNRLWDLPTSSIVPYTLRHPRRECVYVYIYLQYICFVCCCKLCILIVMLMYFHRCVRSVYSVPLCCSVYCLCVTVYCTTATSCQLNCT
jgi:hypothetical protein